MAHQINRCTLTTSSPEQGSSEASSNIRREVRRYTNPPISISLYRFRRPVPYPLHAQTLSAQRRDAENRRHLMTPSTSRSDPPSTQDDGVAQASSEPSNIPYSNCLIGIIKPRVSNLDAYTNVTKSTERDSQDTCTICLTNFNSGDLMRVLQCFHKFHKSCIENWAKNDQSCPLCRLGINGKPRTSPPDVATLTIERMNGRVQNFCLFYPDLSNVLAQAEEADLRNNERID